MLPLVSAEEQHSVTLALQKQKNSSRYFLSYHHFQGTVPGQREYKRSKHTTKVCGLEYQSCLYNGRWGMQNGVVFTLPESIRSTIGLSFDGLVYCWDAICLSTEYYNHAIYIIALM